MLESYNAFPVTCQRSDLVSHLDDLKGPLVLEHKNPKSIHFKESQQLLPKLVVFLGGGGGMGR